ncbi:MAG: hypothetical protein Q8M08_04285 [Bacteroidales bacterium]|nr:hypothetical protein [Bacteroidales bacterium]
MDINAVITGDLVKSRKIIETDIAPVIESLKETFNMINEIILDQKGSFDIYRGDSFQAIIPKPELALLAAIIIRARLRTYVPSSSVSGKHKNIKPIIHSYTDARVAIGVGAISYNSARITESQGEAFVKSGHAYDTIIKNNECLAINTPWDNINQEFDVACKLTDAIIKKWTASTAEAMYHHLLFGKNQQELATQFEISQPGVHKRLILYGNLTGIQAFIKRYQKLMIQ